MKKRSQFIIALLFIVFGVITGVFLSSFSFTRISNIDKRFFYIKKFLDQCDSPITVFLGNSVVMNGVNTKSFYDSNELDPLNLSTPGQSLYEGLIILSEVKNIKNVIWGITAKSLYHKIQEIPYNRINSFYMYGYRVPKCILSIIQSNSKNKTYEKYSKFPIFHYFDSRWSLQGYLDFSFRHSFRKDIDFEKGAKNLFYPRSYKKKILKNVIKTKITKEYKYENFKAVSQKKNFLLHVKSFLDKKNANLYIVILPEHPFFKSKRSPIFYEKMNKYINDLQKELSIQIVNTHNLLSEDMFIDHVHPSEEGAKILTTFLKKSLIY